MNKRNDITIIIGQVLLFLSGCRFPNEKNSKKYSKLPNGLSNILSFYFLSKQIHSNVYITLAVDLLIFIFSLHSASSFVCSSLSIVSFRFCSPFVETSFYFCDILLLLFWLGERKEGMHLVGQGP